MNARCARPPLLSAANGFFSLFYDWSITCGALRPALRSNCARPQPSSAPRTNHNFVRNFGSTVSIHNDATALPPPGSSPGEPVLSTHLRNLMRHMPHSVVVATSTLPGVDSDSPSQYKGMTISSFTTLTLTPVPIVTFNIRRPSQTLDAVRASGKFCVHILSANKEGASVANVFTKGNGRNGPGDIWKSKEFVVFKGKTLEDPPLLRAKGITKVLRCEILEENGLVEVGDHMLVLAKVVGILQPDPVQGEVMEKGLGYLDREYRAVGEVIKLGDDE